jgi:hypothetical protein
LSKASSAAAGLPQRSAHLLVAGQKTENFMGRRRHRYGQTTDKDDPGGQGVERGGLVTMFPVMRSRGGDVNIFFVDNAPLMPVVMAFVSLRVMFGIMVIPFLGLVIIASPPVGHGRSAEKCQSHCQNDNRFKGFGQHVVTSFGSRTVFVLSAAEQFSLGCCNLARGFGGRDGEANQKVYIFFIFSPPARLLSSLIAEFTVYFEARPKLCIRRWS